MEPKKQVEIQLGHMCNNRCVFCVSGQETALGRALPVDMAPVVAEIERAYADGHRKLTLLGGEPTLQPGFLDVVRRSVALGFDEIVIFTNGARTARADYIDEIVATGGNFTWRLSIQGATREAHEVTTKKPGSFNRLVRTMDHLHARGARITVNMCVVQSNFASLPAFPALLLPRGVSQLHLDMVRPKDAGARSEEELRAMIPRYSDMVPALLAMVRGFPEGFDVNIGNLPYCIAPSLSRFIHHDGEETTTIAVDGDGALSRPWNKYFVKRRDKGKPESCATCVMQSQCSGVFEAYRAFYGTDELVPLAAPAFDAGAVVTALLASGARTVAARVERLRRAAPFGALQWEGLTLTDRDRRAELALVAPNGERARVWLAEQNGRPTGGYDVDAKPPDPALVEGIREIIELLRGGAPTSPRARPQGL